MKASLWVVERYNCALKSWEPSGTVWHNKTFAKLDKLDAERRASSEAFRVACYQRVKVVKQ
jgi:hypothetical protein